MTKGRQKRERRFPNDLLIDCFPGKTSCDIVTAVDSTAKKPIIAIVGRPNVGKSSLFNRLMGRKKAVVEDYPGVTRDRNYGDTVLLDTYPVTLIDTGGFEQNPDEATRREVQQQCQLAIEEADLLFFMVDGKSGLLPDDQDLARLLIRTRKPVFLLANKIDHLRHEEMAYDFYSLGFERVFPVSALHSLGIDDVLEAAAPYLKELSSEEKMPKGLRLAIVGKPNVGKSSLVNSLLGQERVIVSDVAGTTRDAIDTELTYNGLPITLIDTAGIRRKSRISQKMERYAVVSAIASIDRCDIAVLVMDATQGVTDQDAKIADLIVQKGKGALIALNKWDLVEKETNTFRDYVRQLYQDLAFFSFAPVVSISARTGKRTHRVLDTALEIHRRGQQKVATSHFNQVLREIVSKHPPGRHRGRPVKILYGTQARSFPPVFILFANFPEAIPPAYHRFLSARLREVFDFTGLPVRFIFKRK